LLDRGQHKEYQYPPSGSWVINSHDKNRRKNFISKFTRIMGHGTVDQYFEITR